MDDHTVKLRHLFKSFRIRCNMYQKLLVSDSDLDKCDVYFAEKQSEYIDLLTRLDNISISPDQIHCASSSSSSSCTVNSQPQPSVSAPRNPSGYAGRESPCILCKHVHRLWHCDQFKSMSPHDRRKLVLNYKLCENCLRDSHATSICGKKSICMVPNCGLKHSQWIHVSDVRPISADHANHSSRVEDTFMPTSDWTL